MTQLVKNLPAMKEIWVQSLGWDNPLEKGKATHSSILAWRIPCSVHTSYLDIQNVLQIGWNEMEKSFLISL